MIIRQLAWESSKSAVGGFLCFIFQDQKKHILTNMFQTLAWILKVLEDQT